MADARGKEGRGLRPGRFAETVGLRGPRPRQGGWWGCAPGASRKRWACAAHARGKGADGAGAPRGPLASPGSPSISRHPGETRSTGKISKAPLAHPFGTGPAGLVPLRLYRSFVHKSSRGVTGGCDGWCIKGRAPRVPSRRDGQGAFLRSRRVLSSRVEAPLPTVGGAGGCKGAARGASPIGPLAAGVGCASPPFPRSPRGAAPSLPCRGRGLRKPTVSAKPPGRSPTNPLAAGVGREDPPFPQSPDQSSAASFASRARRLRVYCVSALL
jgi:hypothetical protein